MTCLFCKIIQQTLPTPLVYEDELCVAFKDIAPQAPHHYLFVPKTHIATINDADRSHQALLGHLILSAQALAKQVGIADAGYRLVFNCNAEGGQAVYHIHLHLLGGRPMTWPPG